MNKEKFEKLPSGDREFLLKSVSAKERAAFIGDEMSLEDFLDCVECGGFIQYDGVIGEVLVDGYLSNIVVDGWGWGPQEGDHLMELEDLKNIEGDVIIVWCNK